MRQTFRRVKSGGLGLALLVLASGMGRSGSGEGAQGDRGTRASHQAEWMLDDEPTEFPVKECVWLGYPSRSFFSVEKDAQSLLNKVRNEKGLSQNTILEELAFLGRGHARERAVSSAASSKSKVWGYVSDRASILYGWTPAKHATSGGPGDSEAYLIAEAWSRGTKDVGQLVDQIWLKNPNTKEALLSPNPAAIGVGFGGSDTCYLVFGVLPQKAQARLASWRDKVKQLRSAETPAEVKQVLYSIVMLREGSSFIHIIPLLRDQDKEVRQAALASLMQLNSLVPEAKGIVFGLMEVGVTSPFPDVSEGSSRLLQRITRQTFTKPKEWRDWWSVNWKSYAKP